MEKRKVIAARARLHRTWKTKLIVIWLLLLSGCGVSIGESALVIGSPGFMIEHNKKVAIVRASEDRQELAGNSSKVH